MKEALELFAELAKLGPVSLMIVGVVALIGWRIWLKAQKDRDGKPTDNNRPATLFDLALFRQELQVTISGKNREIYDRLDDHQERISSLEGRYRHNPRR